MADTLPVLLDRYREQRLQVVFIADGDFQKHMRRLIDRLYALFLERSFIPEPSFTLPLPVSPAGGVHDHQSIPS